MERPAFTVILYSQDYHLIRQSDSAAVTVRQWRRMEEYMRELDYGKMGNRIRRIRKVREWSQDKLAKKCGISMSFLGHIERGTRINESGYLCKYLCGSGDGSR